MPIEHKRIFVPTIQKMYWLEAEMENLGIWEAKIELMDREKEAIDTLANDSATHRFMLEEQMEIANIDIPNSTPVGVPKKGFDFSGMDSPEMFKEIMKYEILAKNSYKDLLNTSQKVLSEVFPDERQRSDFLKVLEGITEDEERHENICRQQVGGFQTINSQRK